MPSNKSLTTQEALLHIGDALDRLDDDRRRLDHETRLELVTSERRVARRLQALAAMLVAEADAAGSSQKAKATPTTQWLLTDPTVTRGEALGAVFTGRELAANDAVREATLAGDLPLDRARAVVKALGQLPEGLTSQQRDAVERDLVAHVDTVSERRAARAARESLERVAPEALPSPEDDQRRLDEQRRRAHARRHLFLTSDGDGGLDVRGNLLELDARPLVSMIEKFLGDRRRELRDARDRLDPRSTATPEQQRADAFVELVRSLHAEPREAPQAERPATGATEHHRPTDEHTQHTRDVAHPGEPEPHGAPSQAPGSLSFDEPREPRWTSGEHDRAARGATSEPHRPPSQVTEVHTHDEPPAHGDPNQHAGEAAPSPSKPPATSPPHRSPSQGTEPGHEAPAHGTPNQHTQHAGPEAAPSPSKPPPTSQPHPSPSQATEPAHPRHEATAHGLRTSTPSVRGEEPASS